MKRVLIFIFSVSILLSVPIHSFAAEKEYKAKSSILMCMNTGDVIEENNAYEKLSPASVTKVMSILLFLEAIDSGQMSLSDKVTASENAVSKGGSQIWLEVGEQMTVEELLKAVVIASANDACTALSEHIGGSSEAFVKLMNSRAKELKLKNTHFENCTGLDDDITNHYSCAYDIAVMSREVMKHKLIKDYSTVWLDSLRGGKTELNNTNKLVNKYNGITGLKTGTTSNAGFCLCATAERDGLSLVSVVLGAPTSEDRFNLAAQLLDRGFAEYRIEKLKIDNEKIKAVRVKNGILKSVKPVMTDGNSVLLKKDTGELEYVYKVKDEVKAPIKKGYILGEIVVKNADKSILSVPLKSDISIDEIDLKYIFIKILKNI